jgi:hypothetical protein
MGTTVSPSVKKRAEIQARRRNEKLARSAHAYMRGNTLKFCENLGARMPASRFADLSVVICELLPQDVSLELDQLARQEGVHAARYLAGVVGTRCK